MTEIDQIKSANPALLQPDNHNKKYEALFVEIDTGQIKLPMFQREFVWDKEQSAKLIDSILKGYPIGTFIFWKTKEELRSYKEVGNHKLPTTPKGEYVQYILDGQQRITSLYAIRKGIRITKDDKELDYKDIFIDLTYQPDADEELVVTEQKEGKQYVSVHDVLSKPLGTFYKTLTHFQADQVETYKGKLTSYDFSTITIKDYPIDVACEVFSRINTGGKVLTVFEIMVAKTYDETKNFDLAEKYEILRDGTDDEKDCLTAAKFETIPESIIMQCVAAIILRAVRSRDILKIRRETFIDNWEPMKAALFTAIDFIRSELRVPVSQLLPYPAAVVPLTYFFHTTSNKKPSNYQVRLLEQFFYWVGFPIRHAAQARRVPIVIAAAPADSARRSGVDESLPQFGDRYRRRSATLLLQEYLNAKDNASWGLVSDGITLRLMRDNISLTRPAWIEANLSKIFSEGLFPDFSALWLLIHQSRFGRADAAISDCALQRWHDRGRTDGVAARDKLRQGVEAALLELGQGFIENPANTALRQELTDGTLSGQAYFEQLLRVIYRLIFLFAAEDRGLLHPTGALEHARKVYAEGYSLARLRERSMRRIAWDRHADSWEGLKATFHALMRGQEKLGLPALGGLFAPGVVPDLETALLENRRLLAAIWRLAWLRPSDQPLTRVNWRDMETEELGSVYESLLELTPRASADARTFEFAVGEESKGNARKTSGSVERLRSVRLPAFLSKRRLLDHQAKPRRQQCGER